MLFTQIQWEISQVMYYILIFEALWNDIDLMRLLS
jgi:hypothetical protein